MEEPKPSRNRDNDLRVIKTRDAIQQAFEKLLETNEYTEITVSAIAREARVSRKTFYAHYRSVDELLRIMAERRISAIASEIKTEGKVSSVDEWIEEYARSALLTLHDNPYLNSNLLQCVPLRNRLSMMRGPLIKASERDFERFDLERVDGFEYCIAFFLSGICAVYEMWVLEGQDESSLESIVELVSRATAHGIADLLK